MVRIERIKRTQPEPEVDPSGTRFQLVEVYVQQPTNKPNPEWKVSARPYEFDEEQPTKYATSCPHCGQGIWFEHYELRSALGELFIHCPECGEGATTPIPPMIDPFVNPIKEKIAETTLDQNLSSASEKLERDDRTLLDKIAHIEIVDPPEESELEEMDTGPDQAEITELLLELEGRKRR